MTAINTAQLSWQTDDNGMTVPSSTQFGDVYFSKANGLAESRYVFIEGNDLPARFANLGEFERFVIGEIGFGTGLNVLAIWQLWQQVRPPNFSHLHIITTEKFPLIKSDLQQALSVWHELMPFAKKLIDNYPLPLSGCHRLNFFDERLTIDIWLGDATDSLTQIIGQAKVNAWLLDGFAPTCNAELWTKEVFKQVARLSNRHTTLATFSVANRVKKGLSEQGFMLAKRKGFGKKREMLIATFQPNQQQSVFKDYQFRYNKKIKPYFVTLPFTVNTESKHRACKKANRQQNFELPNLLPLSKPVSIVIVGAGVAGLCCAYALANRGHDVTIIDKDEALSGASGNIRGFLAPKLTRLSHLETNLHVIGYLASCRFYPYLTGQTGFDILTTTGCLDLLSHNRLQIDEVKEFPPEFAQLLTAEQAEAMAGFDVGQAIFLPNAGLIDTANFAKAVLSHPNIRFRQATLSDIQQVNNHIAVQFDHQVQTFDHAILCMALATCDFLPSIRRFNVSRGQVSWFKVADNAKLPKLPLKYGGYCAKFSQEDNHYFLLGASFVRGTLDTTPTVGEHASNLTDLASAIGTEFETLNLESWYGRAGIRSQTVDYLPLVGQIGESDSRMWTFSALGSKGYCYAPICSELLASLISGEVLPLSEKMVKRLSPNRHVLKH